MAEPEWDEDTRNLVLGYANVDLCPRCGGPAYLCQDPAREFDWTIPAPVRCHRLTALRHAQKGVTEQTNPVTDALIWSTILRAGGS
jgi:hypothetical protein